MESRQQMLRRPLAALVLIQLAVAVIAALLVSPPRANAVAPAAAPPPPPPAAPELLIDEPPPAPAPAPGETDAADPVGATVALFERPEAAQPFKTLTNPTSEKVPLVLHVIEDRGPWLHVRVNIRPNGKTAWIRRTDVNLRRVPNRIIIEVGERRLTVLHGNDVLARFPVGVGTARTPTPIGEFYVDATVHLRNTSGPYGVGQLSVSGFSEVLFSFGGGIGQIAVHGTNNPRAVGGAVSNGCIRMQNAAWAQVAALAPNGTPVSIRP